MHSVELKVYLDNEFFESYSMSANDLPRFIEIDVKEKQTIRFVASIDEDYADYNDGGVIPLDFIVGLNG